MRFSLLLVLMTLLVIAPKAWADPGPAPAPREYRVLQKLHTDAIATFIDAGAFRLGTKADVPEGLGTRLDPETLWFHLDDASKLTVPAGWDFLAPAGTEVWIAPQSNPSGTQLWPGFSTESVPAGAIDGDQTTLRLVKLEGPGALELFTVGGLGERTRLWSSDENLDTFRVGRTHMHANWAFTKAGTYKLTVAATAAPGHAATMTYTFVVGGLPAAAATTTALTAAGTELTATVTPATAAGFVEFRAGATVLGHARVAGGEAKLNATGLPAGTHTVTAGFVPDVLNLASRSTSPEVTVTVGGEPFGVAGVATSYRPGDTLSARVVGATLGAGQNFQWRIRPVGSTGAGTSFGAGTTREVPVDVGYDGYELAVRLRTGTTVVAESAWTPIRVAASVEPVTAKLAEPGPFHLGEPIRVDLGGRAPAAGETVRLATRTTGLWFPITWARRPDASTIVVEPLSDAPGATWVAQVVRDGLVVAQSETFGVDVLARETLVEGIQGVYRAGQTLRARGTVHPPLAGVTYRWILLDLETFTSEVVKEGKDATELELPMTLAHDGKQLTFGAVWDYGAGGSVFVGQQGTPINVSSADPSEQLFFFNSLGDHYHQGGAINLTLAADPAPADGETIEWEWKWPDQDWIPFAGEAGLARRIVAEQALDGVQVRATLGPKTADPVTIHVDDHGAPANQKVSIAGATSYVAGDTATLTAAVAPTTILDRYQWYDGDTPIPGANAATYRFTATAARTVRVAVLKPDGDVAYGPSAPVAVAVQPRTAHAELPVGGVVAPVLGIALGAAPSFGTFQPATARTYTAATSATVTTTLRDARLTVSDPSATATGHLVNGDTALASPLRVGTDALTRPITLRTFARPVAGEPVAIAFEQAIGAREALGVGTYAKTLTFTLATTMP
ncbi:choice-of-anchor M domain-containing protein [Solirubrobacter taibaiensis]|nr:choice-of-anchor M domain-containing protein [Solirubrobacter taibaiensis]